MRVKQLAAANNQRRISSGTLSALPKHGENSISEGRKMKKHGIMNSHIASVLSCMGHTDTIGIADCGLPIPEGVARIDLSIKKGLPSFLDVLDAVMDDMVVEKIILAEEIKTRNPELFQRILDKAGSIPLEFMAHEAFKSYTVRTKAIIRTGEATPYANVILVSGVIFS